MVTPRSAGTDTPSSSYVRVTSEAPPSLLAPATASHGARRSRRRRRPRSRELLPGADLVGTAHHDPVAAVQAGHDLHEVLAGHAHGHRHLDRLAVAHDP